MSCPEVFSEKSSKFRIIFHPQNFNRSQLHEKQNEPRKSLIRLKFIETFPLSTMSNAEDDFIFGSTHPKSFESLQDL